MTSLTRTTAAMIAASQAFPGAHLCDGEPHGVLMAMARRHAQYQAQEHRQGHQHWSERMRELEGDVGSGYRFVEICAESWPEQADDPLEKLAEEMFKSWRQSEGHWSVASVRHDFFGCDIAKGSNGIWYACAVCADRRISSEDSSVSNCTIQ